MRFIIKWRFLLKLGIALLVVSAAIHFVHEWQIQKQVGVLLRQADLSRDEAARSEEAGNVAGAATERERERMYLERYLAVRDNDIDVRDRLARLMCKTAKSDRQVLEAFFVLEDVLRRDPSRDDLRRFTIDFIMISQLGLYREALGHIETLMQKRLNNGELEGLWAQCYLRNKEYENAAVQYKVSLEHRPDLISSYAGYAVVSRVYLNKAHEADRIIIEMLKKNEGNFRAHLVAANYWKEFGKTDESERAIAQAIEKAIQLAPNELEVILAASDNARTRSRKFAREHNWQAAAVALLASKTLLTHGLELHPQASGVYLAMASLEAETRQLSDAVKVIQKGLEVIPNSTELMIGLLDYQYRAHDVKRADETLEKIRERGLPSYLVDYEHSRVLILKGEWLKAARTLEQVIPQLQFNERQLREASLLLGQCYEQLGENDHRLLAFTRALPRELTDPLWVPAMLGIAEAHAALGQSKEALNAYRRIKDVAIAAWLPVARLELLAALQSPDEKPNWTTAEEAISMAEKAVANNLISDSTAVKLLRVRLSHYRGKHADARQRLEELRSQRPKDHAVWIELAMQDARENNLPKALGTLAEGEMQAGDSAEIRLARAQLWTMTKEPDLSTKIASLASNLEKFSLAQQCWLLRGLAEISVAIGANEMASQLWDQLARMKPFDLSIHLIRFDWAVRTNNSEAMERALQMITAIDGENGQSTRLSRAIIAIWRSQVKKDRALRDEALTLLDALERERVGPPLAGKVVLSQGLIYDLNDNTDAALEKYQQAIALGEPNPQALRRVMELLSTKKQFSQAMAVFQKLPAANASGTDVLRLAAEVSLQTDKWREAMQFAARVVPENSTNYQDLIWLGRVYWSAGDRTKPEAMFRKATELAPDAMDAWLMMMQYLIATGRKDDAAKKLDQAKDKVRKTDLPIFLAMAYAQLEKRDQAVDAYKNARSDKPNDVRILLAEAEYLLQIGRLTDAREGYRRVIGLYSATAADKAFARQRLALAMAADPDYTTSKTALDLLDSEPGTSTGVATPGQHRAKAVILALQKDRTSKLEAIRLLEENTEGRTPNEQFLLARLHNMVGNQARVRIVMSDLLKSEKNRIPLYVTFFAFWLIRQDDIREAEDWIEHLIKTDPDSLPTAELKARLAAAKKDFAGARSALLPKANAPGAPLALIARVCEELGLYDDAESLLKKFVEQNKQAEPRVILAIAAYYGRRGQTTNALKYCDEARVKLSVPIVGEVAIRALYNSPAPTAGDMGGVARWLEEAAGKSQGTESAVLLQELASVRNLQGNYTGSTALYRQAIKSNGRDALAMNNLAYLLSAHENQHDEALGLIEQAKQLVGPNPTFLDTEAMIRLNKGGKQEVETALKNIKVVVEEAPSGVAYFHLAQVELAAKHDLEARLAWRRAGELGLRVSDLHPLERPAYTRIASQFK